jgi:DNA-binding LacI/PurR family transcriptional regulator
VLTQEDIAKAVGLSRMTIYRYLTGKNVTKKTRDKIERFISNRGYRPNLTARGLVLKQTKLIGLLVPSVSYSYYPEVVEAIQKEIKGRGYNVLLCVSDEDPEQEREELNLLLSIPVDGIIISPTSKSQSEANCKLLEREKPPFVMFDRYFINVNASYVTTNSFAASKKLVQHLIDMGHRSIAHIGGPHSNAFAKGILQGYRRALQQNNIVVDEDLIASVAMDGSNCIPAFQKILQQQKRPTAVQAVNDPVAIEILKAANRLAIRVPEDLAVIGFSDSRLSEMLAVPLTTVREPTKRMAAEAVNILFDQIETKSKKKIIKNLAGKIILRRSCGAVSPSL